MNLPNYFLVDLPPGATLSRDLISEACQTLKHNRAEHLAGRTTERLIQVFHELSQSWRDASFPFRREALAKGPAATGFSEATIAKGLDAFFEQITGDNLLNLLEQELGHPERLDGLVATPGELKLNRAAIARGPELLAHVCAGNVPNPTLLSMIFGFLVRSAQMVKCATGTAFLPRLFAHSLYELEPKLGACLELVEWTGGNEALEDALFAESDCVTVTGGDDTLAAVRRRLPPRVRFVGYGHRLSFGFIAREALAGFKLTQLAEQAASDIVAWNQLGCLSPHLFYVEAGGQVTAEQFAEALAVELGKREQSEPRGTLPPEISASIAARRSFYEIRAAHSPDTRRWFSEGSTAWTVVYEADPQFQLSCLNRFVYVKSVAHLGEALHAAEAVRGQVSTVGLAAPSNRAPALALELANWGVSRICPLGQMQRPRLAWRHDGRPSLAELVTWTDWER